jgi:hypothetical protein
LNHEVRNMKIRFAAITAVLLGMAAGNALACYTVYDRANKIVYYAQTPPFDMTPPFNDRLQQRFPGGHMVFGNTSDCPARQAGYNPAKAPATTAPLLTDRQTAEDMKLPHKELQGGVVVVDKPPANMKPGFTVMSLGGRPAATADTGRAANAGIQPAPKASKGPVITEMRNPPLTVIQKDGSSVIEAR